MKIAFFCSCLEPGKDGVGDYMRQLAAECARQSGGNNLLVSLNDGDLPPSEATEERQEGLRTLRLGAGRSWSGRAEEVAPVLKEFSPDAVSFHYIPFGFHPRGLAHGWPGPLHKLFQAWPIHLMFHELWLGSYLGAPWKERLLGEIQKLEMRHLVRKWRPRAIHTSNPAYVSLLREAGIPATRLRMYGAIPKVPEEDVSKWFAEEMEASGITFDPAQRDDYWFGLFFGTLHANWPHEPLFGILEKAAAKRKKKVVILSLGFLRSGDLLWSRLQHAYRDRFQFARLGQKPSEDVARLFASVDFGLTSSPGNILGKSSAAAAMMDHELPVLVNWEGRPLRLRRKKSGQEAGEPLIWKVDENLSGRLDCLNRDHRSFNPVLPLSARQLLRDLGHS